MTILFSIFAWKIPWTEEPGGLYIVHEVAKTEQLTLSLCFLSYRILIKGIKVNNYLSVLFSFLNFPLFHPFLSLKSQKYYYRSVNVC